jgi:hypothetical protein
VFEVLSMLAVARAEIALLWVVDSGTKLELEAAGASAQLRIAGIVLVADLGFSECISLLERARCVIAGPEARFVDEAKALGVDSVIIDSEIVVPVRLGEAASAAIPLPSHQLRKIVHDIVRAREAGQRPAPEFWDGGAAERIASHLGLWLRKQNRSRTRPRAAIVDPDPSDRGPVVSIARPKSGRY